MTPPRGSAIHSTVVLLGSSAAALGSQVPGISFFTGYAPPEFGVLKLMTGGLTLAVFVWVLARPVEQMIGTSAALKAVGIAIVLAVFYCALLKWTTVPSPSESGASSRFQIGFGLSRFSLTPRGAEILAASKDPMTSQDLLLATAGYRPDGSTIAWKLWTITTAWFLLSAFFVLSYLAWSFGMACLARELRRKQTAPARTRAKTLR